MCLKSKWTEEKTNEWLKNKPETITAYKLVQVIRTNDGSNRIWPPIWDDKPYKKTNRIPGNLSLIPYISSQTSGEKYWAGYHLFFTKRGAEKFAIKRDVSWEIVLKCSIPKKDVLAVGKQYGCMVIVTKEFTFVEGDEHFGEKKQCA